MWSIIVVYPSQGLSTTSTKISESGSTLLLCFIGDRSRATLIIPRMKKLILFLTIALASCFIAKAQYSHSTTAEGPLSYKWGGIYDGSGHRLTRSEGNTNYFLTPEQQRLFKRGQNQYFWGAGLFLTGLAANAFSARLSLGGRGTGNSIVDGSIIIFSCAYGIPSMIGGATLFFSGRHKLKDLTQDYNFEHQNTASLSFGPQQYGYGLSLTF